MKYTHEIHVCTLQQSLDFNSLRLDCSILKVRPFHCIHWRQFGVLCQVFPTGKLICHGTEEVLRRYLRVLQKPIRDIKLSTRSAVHDLGRTIDYYELHRYIPDVTYEPEVFPGALLKRGRINFTIFHSGKVCITGIRSDCDVDNIVLPVLLELEIV
jgi:TATA-box binding protein (TBP) (component of TFIID and TFIIIB)